MQIGLSIVTAAPVTWDATTDRPRVASDLVPAGARGDLVHVEQAGVAVAPAAPGPVSIAADRPARYRTRGEQRAAFVAAVVRLAREQSISEERAAQYESARTDRYPDLRKLGYHSFRHWKRALVNDAGQIEVAARKTNLVDRYPQRHRTAIETFPPYRRFVDRMVAMYAHTNQMALTSVHRLCAAAARHDGAVEDDIPSLAQVDYWLKTRVPQVWLRSRREGKKYTDDRLLDYISRDWSGVAPGECAFGDHHQVDAPVKVWGDQKQAWRCVRPWVTTLMDARSLMFIGIRVLAGDAPSGLSIQDSLLDAIRCAGMEAPAEFYIDNGKDFCQAGFTEPVTMPDGSEHSIAAELNMRVRHALPRRARSKVIETMFGWFAREFSRLWPAYRGNSPTTRPETAAWYWEHPEECPSVEQFDGLLRWWLAEIYAKHAGERSKITGGRSPAELWAARQPRGTAFTPEQLWFAMLLPLARPATVAGGGVIRFGGADWQCPAGELWPLVGQQIMLKVDRYTRDEFGLVAFDFRGRMLCRLERKMAAPALCRTDADYELLASLTRKAGAMRPWLRALDAEYLGTARPARRVAAESRQWLLAAANVPAPDSAPAMFSADSAGSSLPLPPNPGTPAGYATVNASAAESASQSHGADVALLESLLSGDQEQTPAATAGVAAADLALLDAIAGGPDRE
jgi:hypothetical protein